MTTSKLSPEELKALLGQRNSGGGKSSNRSLVKMEIEALTELLHVSFSGSTKALSLLLSKNVTISAPKCSVKERRDLFTAPEEPMYVVLGEFQGSIRGLQFLMLSKQSLEKLVEPSEDTDDLEQSFQVIQNIVDSIFTSLSESMSTIFEQEVTHSITGIDEVDKPQEFPVQKFINEESFMTINFTIIIDHQIEIPFNVYIPVPSAKQIVEKLTDAVGEQYVEEEETEEMSFQSNNSFKEKETILDNEPTIQSVQFSNFDDPSPGSGEPNNLNMLLDIPLQLTVELGRTKRMVKEILEFSQGSIIELDKLAGEPVDILINNKLIAVGEVVVIDENFGVRVTDILSTEERISKLR